MFVIIYCAIYTTCLKVESVANATGGIHVQRIRVMYQFCVHSHGQVYCNYSHVGINCNNEHTGPQSARK